MVGKRDIILEDKDREVYKVVTARGPLRWPCPLETPSLCLTSWTESRSLASLPSHLNIPVLERVPLASSWIFSLTSFHQAPSKDTKLPGPLCPLLFIILFISRYKFQVVGGCDVVVSSKFQQHLLGILSH